MGRLSFTAITSLDGYVADAEGRFDWSMPDEQVHAFVNDLERGIGTHLYGRRLYEVLVAWETLDVEDSPIMADYAQIWRGADKVVFSRTLQEVGSRRTTIERELDVEAVRRFVDEQPDDVSIGGPTLAAEALRAGIVDDVHLLMSPVVVGGGTRALPDDVRLDLELVSERRFDNGVVHLHHRLRR
ncbi:dihydrofolate reductase family protein [Angustibacter peucedani]